MRIAEILSWQQPVRPARRPLDIIDFLMQRGGVQDYGGELRYMDLHRVQKGKFGRLARRNGMPLDIAREVAAEAGYIDPNGDINDLLQALFDTTHGQPVYSRNDANDVIAWQHEKDAEHRRQEEDDFWNPNNLFAESTRLDELFSRPLPYQRVGPESYIFDAGGKKFQLSFETNQWTLLKTQTEVVLKRLDIAWADPFATQKDFTGNPISVYATCFAIISEYIHKKQPDILYFYGADDAQAKAYQHILKWYNKMLPWARSLLPSNYDIFIQYEDGMPIINIKKGSIGLDEMMNVGHFNRAEKPILRTTDTHYQQAQGNKSQLIVLMSPWDFLKLGTGSIPDMDRIKASAQKLRAYNQYAKSGENIQMPTLWITINGGPEGKVTGHEGRHRAAAVIAARGKWMRVAISLRPAEGYESEMAKQQYAKNGWHKNNSEYTLTAVDLPRFVRDQFSGLYLIPTENWKIEQDDNLRRYRR